MIAVVTGSSGFIGSHLVDALIAGGATVRALVRPESRAVGRDARVAYWTADLLDDRSVRESPIWHDATHVFHVGGVTKRRTLGEFRAGNVTPTANILAALAARAAPVRRVVLVSSQTASGPADAPDRPVREDDPPHPVEAYGRSKLEAEQATRRYSDVLPITILRLAAVYGPRDVDFLNAFKQATNRVAVYAAPRDQLLSVVHVRDCVRALLLAADAPAAIGRTYFVASATPASWRDIYAHIAELSSTRSVGVQIPDAVLGLAGRAGNAFSMMTGRAVLVNTNKVALSRPKWWLCDSSRIRDELGWHDEVSLQAGLHETYLWYLREGWLRLKADAAAMAELPEERV
ncbi:MAG: NAD-dependent epimerase/dehydratase family protein [bacterium]